LSVNKAPGGCASTRNDEHGEVNLDSQGWKTLCEIIGELSMVGPEGVSKIEPRAILDRRLVKKNNAGQAQILVEWSNLPEGRLRKHTYKKMSHGPARKRMRVSATAFALVAQSVACSEAKAHFGANPLLVATRSANCNWNFSFGTAYSQSLILGRQQYCFSSYKHHTCKYQMNFHSLVGFPGAFVGFSEIHSSKQEV